MEPFVVALLIAISVLGLVVLFGVWNVWYRHVHGYSFITRIRRSRSKTAILASVVEEEGRPFLLVQRSLPRLARLPPLRLCAQLRLPELTRLRHAIRRQVEREGGGDEGGRV